MTGLVSYGVYVPYWRVDRSDIAAALGVPAGRGTRAAASYDEDTTTMGTEAARHALRSLDDMPPKPLFFATTEPAYLDKTNANAVHAALDLDPSAPAFDMIGGTRSGVGAALAAERLGGIAVIADRRTGAAGSQDESGGGDAAAAFVFGHDRVIAELVGTGHATRELLECWRLPGEKASRRTDERYVDHVYGRLTEQAVADALKMADISTSDVDHLIITGPHPRVARAGARYFGATGEAVVPDLTDQIGHAGAAHWALLLAGVLDRAEPHRHIVVLTMGDGVTVMVFHTTSHLDAYRAERRWRNIPTLADQLEADTGTLPYARFVGWRGLLVQDSPPQADLQPFSPIAAARNAPWKFGLVALRDDRGAIRAPATSVPSDADTSSEERTIDNLTSIRLADLPATIAALTVDHASPSPASQRARAVIEFDGGGRLTVELTDVDPTDVRVGDRVEMTFRRLYTWNGIHDYFWKARPLRVARGS